MAEYLNVNAANSVSRNPSWYLDRVSAILDSVLHSCSEGNQANDGVVTRNSNIMLGIVSVRGVRYMYIKSLYDFIANIPLYLQAKEEGQLKRVPLSSYADPLVQSFVELRV